MNLVVNFLKQCWRAHKLAHRTGIQLHGKVHLSYPDRILCGQGCSLSAGAVLRANAAGVAIRLGQQVSIHESALLAANGGFIDIGDQCWISPNCVLYGNGGLKLGSEVLLGPGVCISTVGHSFESLTTSINQQPLVTDPVTIENNVWIGMNASIAPGVHIGEGAVIAAGSVVTRNVPAFAVVGGVPARQIKSRLPDESHPDEEQYGAA